MLCEELCMVIKGDSIRVDLLSRTGDKPYCNQAPGKDTKYGDAMI